MTLILLPTLNDSFAMLISWSTYHIALLLLDKLKRNSVCADCNGNRCYESFRENTQTAGVFLWGVVSLLETVLKFSLDLRKMHLHM